MPAPELEWKVFEVPAEAARPPGALRVAAPAAEPIAVELPDLTAFFMPLDKARILLETAAEVEHALLVQYLYATFGLRDGEEVGEPERAATLDAWGGQLRRIARQEMGHLMTVQNLLIALGSPPNLEREDFPPRKDLYPFPLHLEPLTQRSLAKYVVAEAPAGAEDIDDIAALAIASAGARVNRVGVLYGLLGVVFSTPDELAAGGSGSNEWDAWLRLLAAAAHKQAPAPAWHLDDGAIDQGALGRQAQPGRWQRGNTVHVVSARADAREAIRDVAEEGEGISGGGAESHFSRLRDMYRGTGETLPFPAAGEWVPARAVPTDPRPDGVAEPRTRRWMQLADIRYALLLGAIEHHLLITDEDARDTLAAWAFTEMFALHALAEKVAMLPAGGGVGAVPFTLPASLHLPAEDRDRWQLHIARTRAAIEQVDEMRTADPEDAADGELSAMREDDEARLRLMSSGPAPPPATTSFARDILALFRAIDIEHMNDQVGMDLGDLDVVRGSASSISRRLKGIGGRRMPPPPDPPLTDAQIELFDRWVAEGFPP